MDQMVSLKVLNVEGRSGLDKSALSQLNFAPLPHFVMHASSDRCGSNIILLQSTNPVELWIDRRENVMLSEEAHVIKLVEKQKTEKLKFQWTVGAGRFADDKEVLEKLVPPSSVEKLDITGYRSVGLPIWFMDIRQYLPNLSQIELCDFPRCNNLPPLGELPNLVKLSLCRLEDLEEWNWVPDMFVPEAEEWNWVRDELMLFPKLEELRIKQCAKLRIKPCLPSARSLYIKDYDHILSSWGESSSQRSVFSYSMLIHATLLPVDMMLRSVFPRKLVVEDSKVPMYDWRLLHHLPILQILTIKNCSDLTASPEIINRLSSVKEPCLDSNQKAELPTCMVELTSLCKLELESCSNMTSLPEWLGKLKSLRRIGISDCKGIMSLPGSIKKLTGLKMLSISGRSKLMKWFESEENKKKVAHITDMVIDIQPDEAEEDI